jgi:SAM-dependent methyltransferase
VTDDAGEDEARRLAADLADYYTPIVIRIVVSNGILDAFYDGARDAAEVATELGYNADALHRVLRALAGRGIVEEDDAGRFALTPVGQRFSNRHPRSLAGLATWRSWDVAAWSRFEHSLRTGAAAFPEQYGRPLFDWLREHADESALFDRSMQDRTRMLARLLGEPIAGLPTGALLVDVGGGNGTLLATILAQRPDLRGILFDLPHVVSASDQVFQKAGVARRARAEAGDFFVAVPPGGDVYVLASVLHDWDDADAGRILRAIRTAMGPGARVVILDAILKDPNAWDLYKLVDLHMLVMLGGRERDAAQWRRLLHSAGLRAAVAHRTSGLAWIEAIASDEDGGAGDEEGIDGPTSG